MTQSKIAIFPRRHLEATDPSDDSLLVAAARRQVGRVDLTELADMLREAMVREALEREGGNITRASDLLGISRQAVQQLIRRFELVEWHQALRAQDNSDRLSSVGAVAAGPGAGRFGQVLPLSR